MRRHSILNRITICIPTYNRAAFLGETLASVIEQDDAHFDVVVSDNASTDNTREIVTGFQEKFDRLLYFRQSQNMGADYNYLKVIELAQGDYCWFLGSDDALVPGAIQRIREKISGSDIILIDRINMSRDFRIKLSTEKMLNATDGSLFQLRKRGELERYFRSVENLGGMFSYLSSLIIKRDTWNEIPVRKSFIGSAWIHVAKIFDMMLYGAELLYLGQPLVLNRTDNDSFAQTVGFIKRRIIDLDYVRLAREIFDNNSDIAVRIICILEKNYFNLYQILSDKRAAYLEKGPEGCHQLYDVYIDCFANRPRAGKKMFIVKIVPVWMLGGGRRTLRIGRWITRNLSKTMGLWHNNDNKRSLFI